MDHKLIEEITFEQIKKQSRDIIKELGIRRLGI